MVFLQWEILLNSIGFDIDIDIVILLYTMQLLDI